MIPTTIEPVLDDLIKHLSRPETQSVRTPERRMATRVLTGYTPPQLSALPFNLSRPQLVATLGGHEIHVDPMLKFPKMVVSKKFRATFPVEMCDDLQAWMSKQFGYEYPVYVEGRTILMHPEALERLKQKLGHK